MSQPQLIIIFQLALHEAKRLFVAFVLFLSPDVLSRMYYYDMSLHPQMCLLDTSRRDISHDKIYTQI